MSSLLIDVRTSPCSLRVAYWRLLSVGSLFSSSRESKSLFPCASVSHWDHCVTSLAPTYVRLVVFSCPCRNWIQSHGEENLAPSLLPTLLLYFLNCCMYFLPHPQFDSIEMRDIVQKIHRNNILLICNIQVFLCQIYFLLH